MNGRIVDPSTNPSPGDPDDKLVLNLFHRFGSNLPPEATRAAALAASSALGRWAQQHGVAPRPRT